MGVFAFFSSRRQRGGSFAAVTRVSRSGFSSYGGVDWGAAGGVARVRLRRVVLARAARLRRGAGGAAAAGDAEHRARVSRC